MGGLPLLCAPMCSGMFQVVFDAHGRWSSLTAVCVIALVAPGDNLLNKPPTPIIQTTYNTHSLMSVMSQCMFLSWNFPFRKGYEKKGYFLINSF